jgi:hypothetical protein
MKKVLIALLVAFGLFMVAAVVGGYFLYSRGKAYVASFTQLQEIPKLEAQVRNQAAFSPPADGELTQERFRRFLTTQKAIYAHLGNRVQLIEDKYPDLVRSRAGETQRDPSAREVLGMVKDLSGLILEAKRTQVEELNRQGFSVSEYEWTRSQVYAAAGIPVEAYLGHVIREVAAGREPSAYGEAGKHVSVPEKNRELVAPHHNELSERAGLVFLGL